MRGDPEVGEPVQVQVGVGRLGTRKVTALRSLEPEIEVRPMLPAKKAVAALREHGLLGELDGRELTRVYREAKETCGGDDPDVETVLSLYYLDRDERRLADGYIEHDWRFGQETDDVVAELAELVGGKPLLVQTDGGADTGVLLARAQDGRELRFDFRPR